MSSSSSSSPSASSPFPASTPFAAGAVAPAPLPFFFFFFFFFLAAVVEVVLAVSALDWAINAAGSAATALGASTADELDAFPFSLDATTGNAVVVETDATTSGTTDAMTTAAATMDDEAGEDVAEATDTGLAGVLAGAVVADVEDTEDFDASASILARAGDGTAGPVVGAFDVD